MKKAHRIVAIISLLSFGSAICPAQTGAKDPPASISGQITIGGKGAADISVVATATTTNPFDTRASAKATTDDEGNYRITGLPPGRFTVVPVAKAYAMSATGFGRGQPGRSINVLAGDEITKVDFALIRGGVITGRITEADGSAIIGEHVTILPSDTQYAAYINTNLDGLKNRTDDRGVYRIYGLAPGTYKVSVGQTKPQSAANAMFRSGSQYLQTFYPGVQDESKATLIEIKEGSEAKDIDIRAGKGAQGFSVSGRVVDSTSGQPVTNIYVGYSVIEDPNQAIGGGMSFSSSMTDVNGKFTLEGLQPGQYAAFTMGVGTDNTSYSETTKFEIIDGDVSGVEIKLRRGATINGIAFVENSHDPTAAAILPTVSLYAFAERKTAGAPSFARAKINPDGSFKFSGLAPGKVRVAVQEYPTPPKGLTLLRVELNGIEQREGIEVAAGAEINDVRLVFSYGAGSLRGTVKVAGGTIPEGATFWMLLSAGAENSRGFRRHIEVDSRGRFTAENIPPGTYELTLRAALGQKEPPGFSPVKQTVTITHGVETQVTIEVNLTGKEGSN